jgi:2-hydroxychromene-2-carboxylate isomerase
VDQTPVFYFDLADPECYLAAERISEVLSVPTEWVPATGHAADRRLDRSLIERLACERGLQPIRWPASWPPRTDLAARAATYAASIGRVTAFSLAAFRQAFAAGRDLDDADTVVIAAAACEIHPAALLKGVELQSVRLALKRSNARAAAAGVHSLPAVSIGELVFEGDDGLERAGRSIGDGG